jgi:hypothetical protein
MGTPSYPTPAHIWMLKHPGKPYSPIRSEVTWSDDIPVTGSKKYTRDHPETGRFVKTRFHTSKINVPDSETVGKVRGRFSTWIRKLFRKN